MDAAKHNNNQKEAAEWAEAKILSVLLNVIVKSG
jgi:hypothetical protein